MAWGAACTACRRCRRRQRRHERVARTRWQPGDSCLLPPMPLPVPGACGAAAAEPRQGGPPAPALHELPRRGALRSAAAGALWLGVAVAWQLGMGHCCNYLFNGSPMAMQPVAACNRDLPFVPHAGSCLPGCFTSMHLLPRALLLPACLAAFWAVCSGRRPLLLSVTAQVRPVS